MAATKEHGSRKGYWSRLAGQHDHAKDRTKARKKPNRKRVKKNGQR